MLDSDSIVFNFDLGWTISSLLMFSTKWSTIVWTCAYRSKISGVKSDSIFDTQSFMMKLICGPLI